MAYCTILSSLICVSIISTGKSLHTFKVEDQYQPSTTVIASTEKYGEELRISEKKCREYRLAFHFGERGGSNSDDSEFPPEDDQPFTDSDSDDVTQEPTKELPSNYDELPIHPGPAENRTRSDELRIGKPIVLPSIPTNDDIPVHAGPDDASGILNADFRVLPSDFIENYNHPKNIDNENTSTGPSGPTGLLTEDIIVGGEDAESNEFQHMAALGWYSSNGSIAFKCGGSLISDRFVLTAAHCTSIPTGTGLVRSEPSIVRMGALNLLHVIPDGPFYKDIPIKQIIKHPKYLPPQKYYDIALIELNNTVQFDELTRPACLWSKNGFGDYKKALITGWGTTVSGGKTNANVLQKATVNFIDDLLCDTLMIPFRNRHWQGLDDHQMCAGLLEGGKDACQGDSGGPLQVLNKDGDYSIIGVISFGKQCAKANQPGIYTKVSSVIDWIETNVWNK